MSQFKNIATQKAEFTAMQTRWDKMTHFTSDEETVKNAGETYLPKLDGMDDTKYDAYKLRASIPMYVKYTMTNFVGMAMRKDVMTDNIPKSFTSNIDGTGRTLNKYINNLLKHFLTYGRGGSMIEYMNAKERAKVVFYPYSSIINWDTRIIDDVEQLSMVVLRESINSSNDMFTVQTTYQYRLLWLDEFNIYHQQVFDGKGEAKTNETTPQMNHKFMKFIPFVIHGGIDVEFPPLLSITDQNASFYRLDADYKHGLHFTALPTPWRTGVDTDDKNCPKTIGSSTMWDMPDGATVGMLEFTGEGLRGVLDAEEACMKAMITLSSRILAPSTAMNETATAAGIRNSGETASLADIVSMLSVEMSHVVSMALGWGQEIRNITLTINNDFVPTTLSGADVASYVSAWVKGGFSRFTLFEVLKKGEIISGDRKLEDEVADIIKEMAERAAMEVKLAKELAEIEAANKEVEDPEKNAESQEDLDKINEGKAGTQPNKGQRKKEN